MEISTQGREAEKGREAVSSRIAYVNPVYGAYFADPFVLLHEGEYYAFGTGPLAPNEQGMAFRVLHSRDLVQWSPLGAALVRPSGFEQGDFWAPEVAFCDGAFYMYYSVGKGDQGHCLRAAVSDRPEGPYLDAGRLTPESCPFAIDAHPYRHVDGSWFLFYAMDFLDGARPGTALVVDRMRSMTELAGSPVAAARAESDWQRFEQDRRIYGRTLDWHTLEGPFAVCHGGEIHLFYSGGNWQNDSYGVDFVTAGHPLGPYRSCPGPRPRLMGTAPGRVLGPGHCSVVKGPDGASDFIVYHAWNQERTARLMRIDPIVWTSQGPRVEGPTWTPQNLNLSSLQSRAS